MATLAEVLGRGYFPKELPPAFSTVSYAKVLRGKVPTIFRTGGGPRKSVRHNLGRPGMLVRTLSLPDPLHYFRLADLMVREWTTIDRSIAHGRLSITVPVDDRLGLRAWVPSERPTRFVARAHHAAYGRYRVQADVSQWYPSTYTHALDWAIRGKDIAKRDSRRRSGLGPLIDAHVRQSQDRQSVGLPIGPDTSLVLGELVLSQVDAEFTSLVPSSIHGFRYYDDYELFAPTSEAAERAIDALVAALGNWQLVLNPRKVEVSTLPVSIEDEWTSTLKRLQVRTAHPSQERSDLNGLFDAAFDQARKYPMEQVLAYMLGHFINRANGERHRVHSWNWRHFEKLLLQASLSEPGVLSKVGHILHWSKERGLLLDRPTIEAALNLLAIEHAARGNGNEVAWAIWLSIQLGTKIRAPVVRAVERLTDDVVALAALHAVESGSIRSMDVSRWVALMNSESLLGEHWLLAYEAWVKAWLPSSDGSDYIAGDDAFAHLRSNDVYFYDTARNLPAPALVGLTPAHRLPTADVAFIEPPAIEGEEEATGPYG